MNLTEAVRILNEKKHRDREDWQAVTRLGIAVGGEHEEFELTEYEAVAVAQRYALRLVQWWDKPARYFKRGGLGGDGPSDDEVGEILGSIEVGDADLLNDVETMQVLDAALTELLKWRAEHLPPEVRIYRVSESLDRLETVEDLARAIPVTMASAVVTLREAPEGVDGHAWLTKERGISESDVYGMLALGYIVRERGEGQ